MTAALFDLPDPPPKGWSVNRLATELRLDRRTVTGRLAASAVEPIGEDRGDPIYSLADAARACFEAPTLGGMAELQQRKLAAQTEAAELALQAQRGELVPADAVRQAARANGLIEREALQNWPARAGPILASEFGNDAVRFTAALERAIREYMQERADADGA
jgi:hypothetical protein